MTDQYLRFLRKLYDELKNDEIITEVANTSKEKVQAVLNYAKKLSRVQNKASDSEEYLRRIKELYYRKYVVKENDIPDEYFEHLSKMYLEDGYGHLDLVHPNTYVEEQTRMFHVGQIIDAQKASLDTWLDYLMSPDSNYIDMWAKIWAFQGMLNIGTINKTLDGYNKRDKKTIAPFVSVNSEVLGKSVLYLKMHLKMKEEDYPDEEVKRLSASESFYQIYGKLLAKARTIQKYGNEGIWVLYQHGSKEDALKLYQYLQGYNTGWCTAADKKTALNQLCGGGAYVGGDFYVYYTKDKNQEYKIPRIAIRMNGDQIGEIRGIAENQNIESEMEEPLNDKLKDFPDSEEYLKKVSDMRKLTTIYKKQQLKETLTRDELLFLYELEDDIKGFGYEKDPRIKEIIDMRNMKADLAICCCCSEQEVAFHTDYVIGDKIVCYWGDLSLSGITSINDTTFPKYIKGSLKFENLKFVRNIVLPEYVSGNVSLIHLNGASGLKLPKKVGQNLNLGHLIDARGIEFPEEVGESLYLNSLLSSIGLKLPKRIGNDLDLSRLEDTTELILPEKINGSLLLNSITNAENLVLPKSIGNALALRGLKSAKGLILPNTFGSLYLDSLIDAEGLVLPSIIRGDLYLSSLKSASGLKLPEEVGGALDLRSVVNPDSLVLPKMVGDHLYLNSLTSAKNLILPDVGGTLYLDGLTSAEGLVCPKNIGFHLSLKSLTVDDLIYAVLPENCNWIDLKDGQYSVDELKSLIGNKKEMAYLNEQHEIFPGVNLSPDSFKRGFVSLWYIFIPAGILLLGIILACFLYF